MQPCSLVKVKRTLTKVDRLEIPPQSFRRAIIYAKDSRIWLVVARYRCRSPNSHESWTGVAGDGMVVSRGHGLFLFILVVATPIYKALVHHQARSTTCGRIARSLRLVSANVDIFGNQASLPTLSVMFESKRISYSQCYCL